MSGLRYEAEKTFDKRRGDGLPGKWWEILALVVIAVVAAQSIFTSLNPAALQKAFPYAVVGVLVSFAVLFSPLLEHVWGPKLQARNRATALWAANRVGICIFLSSAIYVYQGAVAYATLDIQRLIFYLSAVILFWAYILPRHRGMALAGLPISVLVVGLFVVQTCYPSTMSLPVQKQHLEVAAKSLSSLSALSPIGGSVFDSAVVILVGMSPVLMTVFLSAMYKVPFVLRGATYSTITAVAFLVAPYSETFQRMQPVLPASLTTLFSTFTVYHWLVWGWLFIHLVGLSLLYWQRSRKAVSTLAREIGSGPVRARPQLPANAPLPYRAIYKMAEPTDELFEHLKRRLLGQEEALNRLWGNVVLPIWTGRRDFGNALLLGPTGVGKTETAKALADHLYNGRLARFDMNQYTSEHDVTRLLGAPPGYLGYNEPSYISREVGGKSPCVILFDEIEKTHPVALQMMLQLCGEGYVIDTHGARIDATDCIIIMTSNIWPDRADILWQVPAQQLKKELGDFVQSRYAHHQNQRLFAPEFIGRLHEAIAYKPFSIEIAEMVVLQMSDRTRRDYLVDFHEAFASVLARCSNLRDGCRGLMMLYENTVGKMTAQRPIKAGSLISAKREAGKLIVQVSFEGKVVDQEEMTLGSAPAFEPSVLETLAEKVRGSVKGQDAQIDEMVSLIRVSAAGLRANTGRPYGVFLLAGPTGVGKTETAKALARELFGGRMVKHDMGELKNFNDGVKFFGDRYKPGTLTTAVSELGSCVVLLDEIEKANPEVFDSFLSLFDDGHMSDAASGVSVSFKETIVLMSTNLQPDYAFAQSQAGAIDLTAPLSGDVRRNLFAYYFRKELLGRIDQVILYNDLSTEAVAEIMSARVERVLKTLREDKGVEVTVQEAVYDTLAGRLKASSYGVRGLDVFLRDELFSVLATKTLTESKVRLVVHEGSLVAEAVEAA